MRNIFLFIRRFWVSIAFFFLQILSLYLLFTFNRLHRAKGMGMAGEVTGYFNTKYNSIEDFFRMKAENRRIHRMNDSLLNLLNNNFTKTDSGYAQNADSLLRALVADTTGMRRQYKWMTAEVVYATANAEKNYFQINKGSRQGIKEDMAVFSSNGGFAGRVITTSPNFSEIMPLNHVMSKLSVQLKKSGAPGILFWEGNNNNDLTLTGINKADSVKAGDTVLTGQFSQNFPSGRMVGVITRVNKDPAGNNWILKVKPEANLNSLQQVFIAENINLAEMQQLHDSTVKKIDPVKK